MFRLLGPKGHLIVREASLARVRQLLPALRRRFGIVRIVNLNPLPPTVMYDSTDLSQIPRTARAVAGYVGGHWPTYQHLQARFPHARHVSIAVTAQEDAHVLDVEAGDARNDQAAAWIRRQRKRGVGKPTVYTSVANAAPLLASLKAAGIPREWVRVWTAHYTDKPHLCGPGCGFGMPTQADATQWTNHAKGRSLDQSRCRRSFWK